MASTREFHLLSSSPNQAQIPQTRLVTSRWLVLSTRELEGKHSDHGDRHLWAHGVDVESQRKAGSAVENARRGPILS